MYFSLITFSQSTWQIVNPPVNTDFVSVAFTDEAHGCIIASDGTLIKTMDGGETWNTFYPFPGFHINSMYFSDENHGCAVGYESGVADSSLILVTSDGGENWSFGNHEKVNRLNDVFFINNEKGWAVGSRDTYNLNCCLHTLDGGNNWTLQESILVAGAQLFGVHFRDENIGQSCGADGAFFLTNNGGGTSWAMGISMPLVNLNDIYNFGTLGGCIVGDDGTVLYTINNWYQYIEQNSGTIENLHGVSGNPATNEVWAVGDNGTIIYTSNYLLGWATQASGVTENLNDVCMVSSDEGWAVGDNGTILHFSNTSSVENNFDSQIRVYPNPVSNLLYIKTDTQGKIDQIQLYSIEGKLVYQRKADNISLLEIDVSNFLSGIYYLKTKSSSHSTIRKIVIE
jgi:photosystem II stability/assembly factor-like uncharacterized protein